MVDVGRGKEAADAKIRGELNTLPPLLLHDAHQRVEMLKLFAHLPQTSLIWFGGQFIDWTM